MNIILDPSRVDPNIHTSFLSLAKTIGYVVVETNIKPPRTEVLVVEDLKPPVSSES